MILLRAACTFSLFAIMLATLACGDDGDKADETTPTVPGTAPAPPPPPPPGSPIPLPTTPESERLEFDGATFVAERTLPPGALSADQLEPAGIGQTDGEEIQLGRADVGEVEDWELVSAIPEGWRVWRPQAVQEALDEAEPGASLVEVDAVDWPDACLGAARPDEVCAQVVTSGYRIVVETADGEQIVFHAARTGAIRRADT